MQETTEKCTDYYTYNFIDLEEKLDGETPLQQAMNLRYYDLVEDLIAKNAAVDTPNSFGWSPLFYASDYNQPETVELLLKLKESVNINRIDDLGNTALIIASFSGYTQCVELLLKYGAKVNIKNNAGETAYSLATQEGHDSVVLLLYKNGATI